MKLNYTSAEANVCVGYSRLAGRSGHARLVTRLPADNPLSDCAVSWMRKYNVGCDDIVYGKSGRIGIIFTETGLDQRPSRVLYDRENTAFTTASPEDFDWESILRGADLFYFSGITPALSDSLALICGKALETAHRLSLKTACDLNYRSSLWQTEKAYRVMSLLIENIDLLISNAGQAVDILKAGTHGDSEMQIANNIHKLYGIKKVALTQRFKDSSSSDCWCATLYDSKSDNAVTSRAYPLEQAGRIGGGDAFTAGLIYALTHDYTDRQAIEFASAAACLKHTVKKDFALLSKEETERLANGEAGGIIR